MTTALQDRKIDRAFGYLDVDDDGLIETEDVVNLGNRLVSAFGESLDSPKGKAVVDSFGRFWTTLLEVMEVDDDGMISPDEYRKGMTAAFIDGPDYDRVFRPAVEAVSRLCDTDDDGMINYEDFGHLHEAWGTGADEVDPSFRKIDTDEDGLISVDELVEAGRQYYLSDDPNATGNWLFGDVDADV
jgi:Ca2+-binding EF-hand superfamily protein